MITDKDNSTDHWKCPHCGHLSANIIEDAVLKNDWKEILCGCLECNEMYVRRYQFIETVKLIRHPLNEPKEINFVTLVPVENKEIGKTYFWNRNPMGGKKGNVIILAEGGSRRLKGWQIKYDINDEVTIFADDKELFEQVTI